MVYNDSQTFRGYSITHLASKTSSRLNWPAADRLCLLKHAERFQISTSQMLDLGVEDLAEDLGIPSRSRDYQAVILRRARSALEYMTCRRLREDGVLVKTETIDEATGFTQEVWRWPQYTLQWLRNDWDGGEHATADTPRTTLRTDRAGRRAITPDSASTGTTSVRGRLPTRDTSRRADDQRVNWAAPFASRSPSSSWSGDEFGPGRHRAPSPEFVGGVVSRSPSPIARPAVQSPARSSVRRPSPARSARDTPNRSRYYPSDYTRDTFDRLRYYNSDYRPRQHTFVDHTMSQMPHSGEIDRESTRSTSRSRPAATPATPSRSRPRHSSTHVTPNNSSPFERPLVSGANRARIVSFQNNRRALAAAERQLGALPDPPQEAPSASPRYDDPATWPDTPTHQPESEYGGGSGFHTNATDSQHGGDRSVNYPTLPTFESFMEAPSGGENHAPPPWNFSQTAEMSKEMLSQAQESLKYAVLEWKANFEASAALARGDEIERNRHEWAAKVAASKRISSGKRAIQGLLSTCADATQPPPVIVSPIWEWLLRVPPGPGVDAEE
ncbi:hypothetical protein G7046_g834 [Stylonectria norvegica]|nr:hypothetical protein G7046_g834 [Stylonectria norvegica]